MKKVSKDRLKVSRDQLFEIVFAIAHEDFKRVRYVVVKMKGGEQNVGEK